jgi:hypothetical protein
MMLFFYNRCINQPIELDFGPESVRIEPLQSKIVPGHPAMLEHPSVVAHVNAGNLIASIYESPTAPSVEPGVIDEPEAVVTEAVTEPAAAPLEQPAPEIKVKASRRR